MSRIRNLIQRAKSWNRREWQERPRFWGWLFGAQFAVVNFIFQVAVGGRDPLAVAMLSAALGFLLGGFAAGRLEKTRPKRDSDE